MKKIFLIAAALLTVSAAFADMTYEQYLKQQMTDYQNYLEQIDKDFSSFLKQTWYEYKGEKPEKLLEEPKPVKAPVAEPEKKPEPVVIIPKQPETKPVQPEPEKPVPAPVPGEKKPEPAKEEPKAEVPAPTVPPVAEPVPQEPEVQEPVMKEPAPEPPYVPGQESDGMQLSFYGRDLVIPYDKRLGVKVALPISSDAVAAWWESAASTDYKKTLAYLLKVNKEMRLGDWGLVSLLERFSAKLSGDTPERKMLEWFFLNKAGYDAKLGYTKEGITKVMLPSDRQLYSVPFFNFGGVRYYVVDVFGQTGKAGSLYTYKGKYPDAVKGLRFEKMDSPDLGFAGFSRNLRFDLDGRKYDIKAIANRYDIAYLNNFPQADLSVYTSAKTPEWIDKTILPELKKVVDGKSPRDAVNALLRFVQTAFDYKTDGEQFGREKFFFAEETLYYPYSDCEDRSILFAYLVKKLLGLDIIMLDFPGHIATAVDLGKDNTGAVVEYKGKKYTVSDPTYINATVGMVMPDYRNTSPNIIEPDI